MGHFFATDPARRPPQGRKLDSWRRELAATWQAALGVGTPQPAQEPDPAEAGPQSRQRAGGDVALRARPS